MTREGQTPAGRLERLFAVAALAMYSEAVLGLLFGSEGGETPALRYAWIPVYLLTVAAVLPRWREVGQIARANWLMLAPVLLCAVSLLWSVDPGITLRRSIAVAATTLFGLYLAARYDDVGRLRLMGWAFAVLAFASVLFALALPAYGISSGVHAGAWRGVFQQKNHLGQMMVYAAAVFLVLALADPSHRRKAAAATALCAALVLLSTSKTSLVALLMLLGLATAVTALFRYRTLAVIVIYLSIIGAVALTIGLLTDPDAVFGLLGRDASLTGRTDIWEPVGRMIRERVWLGYGYGAFWADPDGPAWYIRREVEWEVPSAHNGWVEVWLDIGLVGLALFVAGFAAALLRAAAGVRIGRADPALWPFLFLALFMLFSLSESSILRQNNLVWVMYVATVAAYGYRPVGRRPAPAYYPGLARAAPPQPWSAWRPR